MLLAYHDFEAYLAEGIWWRARRLSSWLAMYTQAA